MEIKIGPRQKLENAGLGFVCAGVRHDHFVCADQSIVGRELFVEIYCWLGHNKFAL